MEKKTPGNTKGKKGRPHRMRQVWGIKQMATRVAGKGVGTEKKTRIRQAARPKQQCKNSLACPLRERFGEGNGMSTVAPGGWYGKTLREGGRDQRKNKKKNR